jgi:hypothetical protein
MLQEAPRQITNLVHCELSFNGESYLAFIHDDASPIHLRHLAIRESAWSEADYFLGLTDALVVPRLEHLIVQSTVTEPGVFENLAALVARSGCVLRTLKLFSEDGVPTDILQFFEEAQSRPP